MATSASACGGSASSTSPAATSRSSSADGRYSIVFNGEIVNHLELRRELEPQLSLQTHSDTETLLASYLRWGEDAWLGSRACTQRRSGIGRDAHLRLARDPFGIKPLYLTEQHGGLGLRVRNPGAPRAARVTISTSTNAESMTSSRSAMSCGHAHFSSGPHASSGPCAPYRPDVASPRLERFLASPRFNPVRGRSESDWIEETRERVLATVKQHMIADVPIGAFLSGGVDSARSPRAWRRPPVAAVKVFTAGFPGSNIDETDAARRIAKHLGCEHIVLPIEPQTAAEVLPAVQRAFDEPSAANSAVPLWYLSRTAPHSTSKWCCAAKVAMRFSSATTATAGPSSCGASVPPLRPPAV